MSKWQCMGDAQHKDSRDYDLSEKQQCIINSYALADHRKSQNFAFDKRLTLPNLIFLIIVCINQASMTNASSAIYLQHGECVY